MKGTFQSFFLFILFTGVTLMNSVAEPITGVNETIKYGLENGMTVILERNVSSPVVAINVWVKTGSACELEGEYGLAHVHEHMLFKGTKRRQVGEVAAIVEAGGGDINAFTSFDETVYYIVSAKRFLPTALDLLSDVIENSTFDPVELDKELEVVTEEIRRGEDSPSRVLSQTLFSTAFRVHPYGRPIIGTKESVASFTREKILEFYRKWYSPDNMVLVVVGDFDPKEIKGQIDGTFGKISSRKTPACELTPEPTQNGTRSFVVGRDVNTGYFLFSFHTPSTSHPDAPVLDVISEILGGGDSSRLYRKLKEERSTVNDIYAYSYGLKEGGLFVVGGAIDPDKAERTAKEVIAEINFFQTLPITSAELSRAKINIERDFIRAKETMQGQARKIGYFEVETGDHNYEVRYLDRVRAVTPEDIARVSRNYFSQENLTAGVLLPRDKVERVKSGFEKSLVFIKNKEQEEKELPPVGEFEKHELSNGIRVLLKQNPSVPLFAAEAMFLGGLRYEDRETNGVSNFMAGMLTRGTSTRSAEQIAARIESLGGNIEGFSGKNSVGVTVSALSRNFDEVMDIFSDVILHPAFSAEEIERERKEILAALEKQKDNLTGKTVRNFLETLFDEHPYGMNVLGTEQNVTAIATSQLSEFYRTVIWPENMVISIVGDINTDRMLKTLEKLFGSMKKGGFQKPSVSGVEPLSKTRQNIEVEKGKEQTHIVVGFYAPSMTNQDRYAFEVLNSVLSGQGGRLFVELRDKKSLAYSITSFYTLGIESGYFGVYIGTAPQKEQESLKSIKKQLKLILTGVRAEEVERAKNHIAGSYEIGLQKNSSQASTIAFNELYGMGINEYKKYPEKIMSVTPDDVIRVARKYIHPEISVIAVVTPENTKADTQND